MNTRVSPHSRLGRRERRMVGLGCLAGGLMLALSGLHGVIPVAAQTVTAPIPHVEDRLAGTDDLLQQTLGLVLDDRPLADMLLGTDVPQEDRQADRQMEVGDDRLTVQPEQQIETGDVRQEDRSPASDDSRKSSSGSDEAAKPYYGSSSSTVSSSKGNDRTAPSSSTTVPARSGGNNSGGSGHGGGHDDGGGHH